MRSTPQVIVLDTNVLFELMRPSPSAAVVVWCAGHSATSLFTTAINEAEIFLGIELLPSGRRKEVLLHTANEIFERDMADRVLPFDSEAAKAFANLVAARRKQGRPTTQSDAQIAAITQIRNGVLATRNTGDFEDCGFRLVNPWLSS